MSKRQIDKIELIQIDCSMCFEIRFKADIRDFEITNAIFDRFKSGSIITNENKKILPTKVYKRLDFRHGERYRVNSCNLSCSFPNGYIGLDLEFRLTEYYK